jgi:predicted ABC-type exoprotein transport system permease subunit
VPVPARPALVVVAALALALPVAGATSFLGADFGSMLLFLLLLDAFAVLLTWQWSRLSGSGRDVEVPLVSYLLALCTATTLFVLLIVSLYVGRS